MYELDQQVEDAWVRVVESIERNAERHRKEMTVEFSKAMDESDVRWDQLEVDLLGKTIMQLEADRERAKKGVYAKA